MNLFYAAFLVCWPDGCISLSDSFGPYRTHEACRERLKVMEAAAIVGFGGIPDVTMLSACARLEDIRRVIPDVFPGEGTT